MATRTNEPMNGIGGEDRDRAAEIKGDIERTRGDMTRTVSQIEERLSPAHLKEQVKNVKEAALGEYHDAKDHVKEDIARELREAKDKVSEEVRHARGAVRDATVGKVEHMVQDARETVSDAGTTILDTIKANPVPAALVAIGLGWLFVSSRSSGRSTTDRRIGVRMAPRRLVAGGQRIAERAVHGASEMAHDVGDRVGHAAHDVGDRVGHAAHDVGDRIAEVAHEARDTAMHIGHETRVRSGRAIRGAGREIVRAERSFEHMLEDNPLVFGAVAIAIGAAIGLALPHTRREDEWMGRAKERLLEKAESAAGTAIHEVEEKVEKLAGGAQDTPKNGMSHASKSV